MTELINLIYDYEDSIINEESTRKQMNKYLKIEKFMNRKNMTAEDEKQALEVVGACSQMSILNDWYNDLIYRMEIK